MKKVVDYFEVEYYDYVGEHSNLSANSYFDVAYRVAKYFKRHEKKCLGKEIGYIGISSNTDTFAILFITEEYLYNVIRADYFKDENSYNKFLEAGKKYLKTRKNVISTYSELKTFEVVYLYDGIQNTYFFKSISKKECRKSFKEEKEKVKIISIKEINEYKRY